MADRCARGADLRPISASSRRHARPQAVCRIGKRDDHMASADVCRCLTCACTLGEGDDGRRTLNECR